MRDVLSDRLSQIPDIEVVGVAPDPFIARDKILQLKPDVVTLDIEMPRMDGLSFLERLMTYFPIPVIIVSSVTTSDRGAAIKALEIGAFDVVNKPGAAISVGDIIDEIVYKIRQAYEIRDSFIKRRVNFQQKFHTDRVKPMGAGKLLGTVKTTDRIICLGASTGGTVALEYFVLRQLPHNLPPVVIVQHMPPNFTKQFAQRLNQLLAALEVKEAENGEILADGTVYIAPGGLHLTIERRGASLYTKLTTTERVQFQRPSVDVLFQSAAEMAGRNGVAALLTGLGKDGGDGLLRLRQAGSRASAQDVTTSGVWGMPNAAVDRGAAEKCCRSIGSLKDSFSWPDPSSDPYRLHLKLGFDSGNVQEFNGAQYPVNI